MSGHHSIGRLCETLLVSRSGFYDWRRRRLTPGPRQRENLALRQRVRTAFAQSRQTYGSPRLARALGCAGSRNRIARLMRVERLRARQRSKFRVATTDSRHDGPIAPHRLRGVTPTACNEVWSTDVTHILTAQGWLYLAAVLDVHSRKVVGWAMSDLLDAPLVVSALRMAIAQRRPTAAVIVHSDRGRQFASGSFRQTLAAHGLIPSMSRPGNCYDNAHIESFWSSLKHELIYRQRFGSRAEARSAIFDYIESFYNRRRLHSSIGYQSPLDFETQLN
jgi:transposase InsO family protein